MIDYDKLKEIHKIYPEGYLKLIPIFDGAEGDLSSFNYSMDIDCVMPDMFFSADDLLNTLRERFKQKPEPKYKIGQEVFLLGGDEIISFKIDEILNDQGTYWYIDFLSADRDEFDQWREDVLYPSKEALIEAQIEYWNKLRYPSIAESTESFQKRAACFVEKGRDDIRNVQKACEHYFGNVDPSMPKSSIMCLGCGAFPFKNDMNCKKIIDSCKDNPLFRFEREIAGNRYYTNIETNEVHCACGIFADCPHDCRMEAKECEHESNGIPYASTSIGMVGYSLPGGFPAAVTKYLWCKKCGEYYR